MNRPYAAAAALVLLLAPTGPATALEAGAPAPRALTAEDYARAEKLLGPNVNPLVVRAGGRATWLLDGRFWYRNALEDGGSEFVLVDPVKRTRGPAFDHAKLATAITAALGRPVDARRLPFTTFELSADGRSLSFDSRGRHVRCDLAAGTCTATAPAARDRAAEGPPSPFRLRNDVPSPDGKWTAFLKADNLWLREVATGKETALTTDGVKDYGYATDNAGWTKSDRPVLLWSPDSKRIATFQQDQRNVGEMYLVETKAGRPALQAWKYPLPGDATVTMIERVVIHLDGPRVVRLKRPPDQHRGTVTDDVKVRGGEWDDVQWSPDGRQLAFVSTSRDHKHEALRVADPETGDVRDVLEETAETYFESGSGRANWRFLPGSGEVIWFSERDGWGQLYLHDLASGTLKLKITTGEGNVAQVLHVDEKARLVYFLGNGREPGRDPYFRHLYRIGFDGKRLARLTPEDADHDVSIAPSGAFFVDSFSKPDVPPVMVLRDAAGKTVLPLEKADVSRLEAAGWKPPLPFTVKARDGATDLYGLLFRPTRFDPAQKYPIVNQVYPGPQGGSVGSRSFAAARGDTQALAELGFVVVQLDAMGTPGRSKKFHDAWYGNMGDNGLPDQVAGMKELAARFPWIDLERAGIWGHSGGGYAAAGAMFRYPDFFKVGISEAGNHDNRVYEDDWAEKWQGLLVKNADGTTKYDNQANQLVAKNLKGKLLLAHGTLDSNVPPYNTLLVVDELIKANRDFDLLMLPNRGHGFASEPYMVRRRWDYFVRHLMGAEPPREYEIKTQPGPRGGAMPPP
jgi:dipeptidyl aminopeptidase/acylaminoacyl peptidase